jgi:hypothetical protein
MREKKRGEETRTFKREMDNEPIPYDGRLSSMYTIFVSFFSSRLESLRLYAVKERRTSLCEVGPDSNIYM